ncbi:Retinol dehydratase [Operophtera brumata]|uniref:Retinol dehydratase n=1 Tax=Operophtera brumata TaxID=104452 RepID=A0A0L7L630_OPEBR|nr:Retinol dehydratase [Operophtera brumata]
MAGKSNNELEYRDLEPCEIEQVSELHEGSPQECVRVGPKGYYLPKNYKEHASDILSMELKEGDIFVASYQRSGTTWTQELVWLVANNFDYEKAAAVPLTHRYPFLEHSMFFDDTIKENAKQLFGDNEKTQKIMEIISTPALKILAEMPSPRFIKSHLPMSLLPPKLLDTAKVIYVARDPRDVAVSCFHHSRLFKLIKYKGNFRQTWSAFIKDLFILTPYFEHDLPSSIRRVAEFLGKDLTHEQMERLCEHLSIDNFKNNPSVNFEDLREFGMLDSREQFIRKGTPQKFTRVGPKGYYLQNRYKELASDILSMELKEGDIFVTSFLRSGTTWTQELVWLVANDFDYEKAAAVPLTHRYSFLEVNIENKHVEDNEKTQKIMEIISTPALKVLAKMPSPRFIKSHLPMSLLPPKLLDTAKVIYIARDPRDVAVSCFHHARLFKLINYKGNFRQTWSVFIKDLFILTPYFEHVKEAWALRDHPNMLFLFYEDLSKDLPSSIRRVADFLGKDLTQDQMERLCEHLSFDNFKNNLSVNYEDLREFGLLDSRETFIRKENNNFPLEIRDVEPKLAEELMKQFTGEHSGFVQVGPKGYFLPNKFKQEASHIYNMRLRRDDVFVASYPRSVYVHPIMKERFRIENMDSERKLELLEMVTQPATEQLADAPSPRFIKTHLPMSLLPPKVLETAKVVYVARDPRDVDLPAAVRKVAKFFNKQFTEKQVLKLCVHLNIDNFKKNNSAEGGPDEIYDAINTYDMAETVRAATNALKKTKHIHPAITDPKSKTKSIDHRNKGDEHYKAGKKRDALILYNKALAFAPNDSEEMMLAYGNRSAVMFNIRNYTACRLDINTCLSLGCPQELAKKLKKRSIATLPYIHEEVKLECKSRNIAVNYLFDFECKRNADVPSASADVAFEDRDGEKRVTACKDIRAGAVVAIERAFATCVTDNNTFTTCYYCNRMALRLHPCTGCCIALFCNSKCRFLCMKEYHRIECQIVDSLLILSVYDEPASVLMTRSAIKMSLKLGWDALIAASTEIGTSRMRTATVRQTYNSDEPLSMLSYDDNKYLMEGRMFNGSLLIKLITTNKAN